MNTTCSFEQIEKYLNNEIEIDGNHSSCISVIQEEEKKIELSQSKQQEDFEEHVLDFGSSFKIVLFSFLGIFVGLFIVRVLLIARRLILARRPEIDA